VQSGFILHGCISAYLVTVAPDERSARRFVTAVWIVVAITTLARLVVAARLPLSGDEAYYWEWSRRLSFGYYDHPPMVAWLIALFTFGAKSTLLIRLPFVVCGLGCAIMLFLFAARAASATGGATAALLISLVPFSILAFTVASPDGPYLFFWSLSLYLALLAEDVGPQFLPPLALSLAATVLSRVFGIVLALGVLCALLVLHRSRATHQPQQFSKGRWRYVALAALIFAVAIAPYLLWDAAHSWSSLRFALFGRHDMTFHGGNFTTLLGLYAAVLTPGVFVAAFPTIGRLVRPKTPAQTLLFATVIPLLALCLLLALREQVEFYWADGAFVSLIAALGSYAPTLLRRTSFLLVVGPAAAIALMLFVIAALPLESYQFAQKYLGVHLRHGGPFEIWAFQPAALDVAREANARGAWVMTDGYGLSSVLDFYAGIPPVVIGYDEQGREARKWLPSSVPSQAIFFDKEPLVTRPDFARQLSRACARVSDDGAHSYYVNGILARTFYLTRCEGLTPAGFSLLLWR
jgi:hypothetical protein